MTEPQNPLSTGAPAPDTQTPKKKPQVASWMPVALEVLVAVGALGFLLVKQPNLLRTIFVFLAVLGVLVFVHEWGHYQFARWAGMKVNRFGIGFPPWLFTVRRNNIDYSLGALPIGGMVDIAGLGSEEEMVGVTHTGEMPANTRDPNRPRGQKQFQDANLGWRFMTLFAGPMMNFIFAIVLSVAVLSFVGQLVSAKVNRIESVMPKSPALQAGIQAEDKLVGVNEFRSDDNVALSKVIRASGGKPLTLYLKRGEQIIQAKIQPVIKEMPRLDNKPGTEKVASIGVQFGIDWATAKYERVGFVEAVALSWESAARMTGQILGTVGRALTFKLSKEEKDGIGGPVKIAQVVGQVSKSGGWQDTALLAAALSINLGLINLLPFPALDGGRILFLGYELVMRRPFDPRKEGIVHMAGMILLLAFMLFITLRDVASFL